MALLKPIKSKADRHKWRINDFLGMGKPLGWGQKWTLYKPFKTV